MRTRGDRWRGRLLGLWAGLALLYLFIPIFIVALFSFNDPKGRFNLSWEGFTLDHWLHPFAAEGIDVAVRNSLLIAAASTLVSLVLGTFMALALVRHRFKGRGALDLFVFLPLATPEVVLGAALLGLFLTMGTATGFATIVIAHVMLKRPCGSLKLNSATIRIVANPVATFIVMNRPSSAAPSTTSGVASGRKMKKFAGPRPRKR